MELVGVVYHNGATFDSGHYTCLCRGPGGRFWFYDDDKPAVRVTDEVAHLKTRQVYMLVYCRQDGSASWSAASSGEALVNMGESEQGVGTTSRRRSREPAVAVGSGSYAPLPAREEVRYALERFFSGAVWEAL